MNKRTTKKVARQIAHQLVQNNGGVVYLRGAMGAGKTTLVGEIVKILSPHAVTSSPTFTLINQYTDKIYHADFYRLWENHTDSVQIVESTGIADLCIPGNYVFIEWPQNIKLTDIYHLDVTIKVKEDGNREFIIA